MNPSITGAAEQRAANRHARQNPPTGPLLASVFRLGTPTVLESLLGTAVLLTDALMLARLENNSVYLAATSLTGVLYWRLTGVAGCTQAGAGAYVARRWGEERYDEASRALTHAFVLGTAIGIAALLLFTPLLAIIFTALGADGPTLRESTGYFQILLLSFPLRLGLYNLMSCMRAAGDTRTPLALTTFIVLLNVPLNWVFIYGNVGMPMLGMPGAAVGSSLAYLIGAALAAWVLIRGVHPRRLIRRNEGQPVAYDAEAPFGEEPAWNVARTHRDGGGFLSFRRDGFRLWMPRITPTIFRVSRASFGEEVLYSVGFLTYIAMVARFGTEALAAHSATVRIEALSFTAGWGIAVATGTMVGQALGARQVRLARRLFSLNAGVSFLIMSSLGLSFILLPDFYLNWFFVDDDVRVLGRMMLFIIGLEQCFMALAMVFSGGLRGAGDTFPPFITQVFGVIGMRLGVGYILAWPLGMGVAGIYWATALDWMVRALILFWFVRRGKWMRVRV